MMGYDGKKVAVLHIGTMKVGTTSIQRFLTRNAEAVRLRHGISYIGPYVRTRDTLKSLVSQAGAEGKSLVICDEGWWHYRFTNRVELAGIREELEGYEFRVVLYARRPDDFLQSWYLQGLKTGSGEPSFRKFLSAPVVQKGLAFSSGLAEFEKLFGPVTVRPYERSQLRGGNAVSDFLHVIGVEEDGLQHIDFANETPDTSAIFMARLLYELADTDIRQDIRSMLEKIPGKFSKHSIINADEMQEIASRFGPEVDFLQLRYGNPKRKTFFDMSIPTGAKNENHPIREIFDSLLTCVTRKQPAPVN